MASNQSIGAYFFSDPKRTHLSVPVAQLDAEASAKAERPQRFFHGHELTRLRFVRGKVEQMMRVGDRMLFKDPTGLPFTTHGSRSDPNGVVEVRTFTIKVCRVLSP